MLEQNNLRNVITQFLKIYSNVNAYDIYIVKAVILRKPWPILSFSNGKCQKF